MKFYFDWICQPSRALYILLKVNRVPVEEIVVSLKYGEHQDESFKKVNRFQKLPCFVDDDGFQISESVAMLRYLDMKDLIDADHFYPKEPRARARVDEYLEWQANNLRLGGAMYFKTQWIMPRLTKQAPEESGELHMYKYIMEESLDIIENIYLADTTFLASNTVSFADILACCDIEQIRITGYNPFENRPKLENMWREVKKLTSPHYDQVHAVCYKMSKSS